MPEPPAEPRPLAGRRPDARRGAAEDLSGRTLGRFRVEGVLGRGGMSTVYRATDTRLDRRVALKVIDPLLARDAEFRRRFLAEARNTSAVDHPHVVPLYDVDAATLPGEPDERPYIAMRHVEGSDLGVVIGGRPLPPHRALRLLDQVADALDAVHAHGLVHLDVKPANVLVTRTASGADHAYLADFGLTHRGATGHRTGTGDFLGSPTYAAPEHLRGEPVDARTDLYSLGCVLFTCLTGRAPYRGSVPEVIDAHLAGVVPSARAALEGFPTILRPQVDEVLAHAMASDPARRPGSARELLGAARAALGSATAPPPAPAPAAAPAVPPRPPADPPPGPRVSGAAVAPGATKAPFTRDVPPPPLARRPPAPVTPSDLGAFGPAPLGRPAASSAGVVAVVVAFVVLVVVVVLLAV